MAQAYLRKRNPSSSNRSWTYDLVITSPNGLPLSNGGRMGYPFSDNWKWLSIHMQIKLISVWKVVHLALRWKKAQDNSEMAYLGH